jgi:hypothetical protein
MTWLRSVLISAAIAALALAGLWVSVARAQSLTVSRGARSETVTAAQFAALPRASAHVVQHDQPHDFEGVSLTTLLARVGVDASKPMSGRDLAAAVRVTAADGYQVVIALPDIDPATRKAPVIVADREAGAPLKPEQGPWRLVVGDDIRPARSARQITRIEVVDLATSSKAPAAAH